MKQVDMAVVKGMQQRGWDVRRISKALGIHQATLYRRIKRSLHSNPELDNLRAEAQIKVNTGLPEPTYTPAYQTPIAQAFNVDLADEEIREPGSMPHTVEEAEQIMRDFIGYRQGAGEHLVEHSKDRSYKKKILLINDLHVPFHNLDAIRQVIQEHAADTDVAIIGGDLLDLFAVSRYEKFKMHFSLAQELREGQAMIGLLAAHFKKIILMSGNHDERWKKNLVKRGISPAELEAMDILGQIGTGDDTFKVTDPLYCLARMLPNVEVVQPVVVDYAEFGFFYQIGDLVISHAEKFSRIPGQAANVAAQWFKSYAEPKGIVQPFRVLAQCHTHQAATNWSNFGVWALECGCLCRTPDYAANPKLMGAQRDSKLGYSIFYQEDGRTDMTTSRFIPIEG